MNILNNKGFSLIELLIALVISLAILTSMYSLYESSYKSYTIQHAIAEMETNARVSLELMVRELKKTVAVDPNSSTDTILYYIDTNDTEVGMATDPGSGANTLADETKNWTPDEWNDEVVAIVSGEGEGQVGTIISNTSDELTVSADWSTAPGSTSVYHISVIQKAFSWSSDDSTLRYTSDGTTDVITTDISYLNFNTTTDKIDIRLSARPSIKDPNNYTYTIECPVAFRN